MTTRRGEPKPQRQTPLRSMRCCAMLCVALLAGVRAAGAQDTGVSVDSAGGPATNVHGARLAALNRFKAELNLLRTTENEDVPGFKAFKVGNVNVAAGSTVKQPLGVWKGTLDVSGHIAGNAIAVTGDIRVHKGGEITGDAVTIGGHVVLDSGAVDGQILELSDVVPATASSEPTSASSGIGDTWLATKLVVTWFAVLLIIGVGVMIFADGTLDGVVLGLERGIARAFWTGLLGQLLMLPALLVLVVGLAVTLIGILLIPFAIVAYCIAVAGLLTLGFLAIARLSGTLIVHDDGTASMRAVDLRALTYGLAAYMALWLLAAFFTWSAEFGLILRGIAIAVTWVAATAGFGATLLSRAGTRRNSKPRWDTLAGSAQLSWQTPTPISGIARRPVTPTRAEP